MTDGQLVSQIMNLFTSNQYPLNYLTNQIHNQLRTQMMRSITNNDEQSMITDDPIYNSLLRYSITVN